MQLDVCMVCWLYTPQSCWQQHAEVDFNGRRWSNCSTAYCLSTRMSPLPPCASSCCLLQVLRCCSELLPRRSKQFLTPVALRGR